MTALRLELDKAAQRTTAMRELRQELEHHRPPPIVTSLVLATRRRSTPVRSSSLSADCGDTELDQNHCKTPAQLRYLLAPDFPIYLDSPLRAAYESEESNADSESEAEDDETDDDGDDDDDDNDWRGRRVLGTIVDPNVIEWSDE